MDSEEDNENYYNYHNSKSQSIASNHSKTKAKRGNYILRQELNSYTPEFNAVCGIIFNSFLFIIFISIGIVITFYGNQVQEFKFDYTNCSLNSTGNTCQINLFLNTTLQAPIFIYYEIENFHLNHRDLVKSKVWSQLRGDEYIDSTNNSKCAGAIFMNEIFNNDSSKYISITGEQLSGSDYAYPCGLVAKAFFNDTYSLYSSSKELIFINEKGISNQYEKNNFYKNNVLNKHRQWMDLENEHFIVWMAMETYKDFRKLWGKIEQNLYPDNYTIVLNDNYNLAQYNSNKSLVITTVSPLGNSNFMGYLALFGSAWVLVAILLLWVSLLTRREKKFDYVSLKWK